MANYRVYYKKGDLEIEVESTEKDYIDTMLKKFMSMEPSSSVQDKKGEGGKKKSTVTRKSAPSEQINASEDSSLDIPGIVNLIHEDERFSDIEKHILNKRGQLQRVLLALFFAKKAGNEHLTTGQIESITNELGVKLDQTNASHTLSANRKYFTAAAVRKKGAKVPYKLNRQGNQAFEKVLKGEKL